jgi:broad specificity phosphatase PhoE
MSKTVFLIRHAQSEENVQVATALEGWNRLKRFSLPRRENLDAAVTLVTLERGIGYYLVVGIIDYSSRFASLS